MLRLDTRVAPDSAEGQAERQSGPAQFCPFFASRLAQGRRGTGHLRARTAPIGGGRKGFSDARQRHHAAACVGSSTREMCGLMPRCVLQNIPLTEAGRLEGMDRLNRVVLAKVDGLRRTISSRTNSAAPCSSGSLSPLFSVEDRLKHFRHFYQRTNARPLLRPFAGSGYPPRRYVVPITRQRLPVLAEPIATRPSSVPSHCCTHS